MESVRSYFQALRKKEQNVDQVACLGELGTLSSFWTVYDSHNTQDTLPQHQLNVTM